MVEERVPLLTVSRDLPVQSTRPTKATKTTNKANNKKSAANRAKKSTTRETGTFSNELLVKLYDLRIEIAKRENVSPATIFPDEMLREMCQMKPCYMNDFGSIRGMTVFRKNKYGKEFVAVIRDYIAYHPV